MWICIQNGAAESLDRVDTRSLSLPEQRLLYRCWKVLEDRAFDRHEHGIFNTPHSRYVPVPLVLYLVMYRSLKTIG